jgi:hypothetical protein
MPESPKLRTLDLGQGIEVEFLDGWVGSATLRWKASYTLQEIRIPAPVLFYLLKYDLDSLEGLAINLEENKSHDS